MPEFAKDDFFNILKQADKSKLTKAKAVFLFKIKDGSNVASHVIDCKAGEVYEGEPKTKQDVTFEIAKSDFEALINKKKTAQSLFMGGKMKLKGNMAAAMKFESVIKSMEASMSKL